MRTVAALLLSTLLLAGFSGLTQSDIKRVLAYSTISQLVFMAMGLAAAGLAGSTMFAGYYHLTTHAAFKALLFLCAGVFIHHFGTNDFFVMSKEGGRHLRIPMITVTIGAQGTNARTSRVRSMAAFCASRSRRSTLFGFRC